MMNFYYFPNLFEIRKTKKNQVDISSSGVVFSLKGSSLSTEYYSDSPQPHLFPISYKGEEYLGFYSSLNKEKVTLFNEAKRMEVSFSEKTLGDDSLSNKDVFYETSYDEEGDFSGMTCFKRDGSSFVKSKLDVFSFSEVDGNLYGMITEKWRYRYWVKLNDRFETVWKQPNTNHSGKLFDRGCPQPYDDSIIVHSDIDLSAGKRKIGWDGVEARYKETGEIKWKTGLTGPIYSIQLEEDRIYVANGQEIVVLNADDGQILLRHQTNFNSEGYTKIRCIDDWVFFQSNRDFHFKLFDKHHLRHLADIPFPDSFVAHERHAPQKVGEKIYWLVASSHGVLFDSVHGLLVIDPLKSKSNLLTHIEIEARPDTELKCLKTDVGEDYYQITIESDQLDRALRFGEIEVKTVAATYGKQIYKSDKQNPDFNGEIVLQIRKDCLDVIDYEKLSRLEKRLNTQLESFYSACTKNEAVTCRCEWV